MNWHEEEVEERAHQHELEVMAEQVQDCIWEAMDHRPNPWELMEIVS